MFGPKGAICQSCGMPLSKDKNGGGSNADGTKSTEYCSLCYANGAFIQPDLTVEQVQQVALEKMKEMHIPGFLAKRFAKGIPELRRWKQA